MAIQRIPVTLEYDHSKVVGIAVIEPDGTLVIRVRSGELSKHYEYLLITDQIRGLSLGVSYVKAEPKECPLNGK